MLKTQLDDIWADLNDDPIESLHPDPDRQETIRTSPLGSTKLLSLPRTSARTLRFFILRELVFCTGWGGISFTIWWTRQLGGIIGFSGAGLRRAFYAAARRL